MTDIIKAIGLGIVEGLTEFIPVSSTGHLILIGEKLNFHTTNTETFDIAIQLGAILAVAWVYRSFFLTLIHPKQWLSKQSKCIIIACLPALILGATLYSHIKSLFNSGSVAIGLFVGGLIMIIVDKKSPETTLKTTHINDITYKQAFIIGCCQCAALWPGTSRSGSTIVGGLLAKLNYETAASFSFIIAVPIMIAAVGYDLFKTAHALTTTDIQLISIGFIVSFIVALFAITTFLKLISKLKLTPFGIYRLGLASLIWLI